ncbi:head-tail connector protein [Miniphocaeibacter massiliensis]|uniref:head-tail connector protein n=1 Tax=Miniphocaeibacter massiliensis TaxID=2041841 RepID=UPI000C1C7DCA|nr:head-tail connector protein [Miniphocaeibacter massiliensis]
MELDLKNVKLYLRVDNDIEDELISSLMVTSQSICENILRHPISEYETIPEGIKQAILYGVAYLYENRENADLNLLIKMMRAVLYPHRKEVF